MTEKVSGVIRVIVCCAILFSGFVLGRGTKKPQIITKEKIQIIYEPCSNPPLQLDFDIEELCSNFFAVELEKIKEEMMMEGYLKGYVEGFKGFKKK